MVDWCACSGVSPRTARGNIGQPTTWKWGVQRRKYAEFVRGIEVYHRQLKQECGVERAMLRAGRAQRNHIGMAIWVIVRLERHRLRMAVFWKRAKGAIIRHAIRSYRTRPWYGLSASA